MNRKTNKDFDAANDSIRSLVERVVDIGQEFLAKGSKAQRNIQGHVVGTKDNLMQDAPQVAADLKKVVAAGLTSVTSLLGKRRKTFQRHPGPFLAIGAGVGLAALIYANRDKVKSAALQAKQKADPMLRNAQQGFNNAISKYKHPERSEGSNPSIDDRTGSDLSH